MTYPSRPGVPPLSSTQILINTDMEEFQLVDLSRRFLNLDSFWSLPRHFLGNKVNCAWIQMCVCLPRSVGHLFLTLVFDQDGHYKSESTGFKDMGRDAKLSYFVTFAQRKIPRGL